MATIVKFWRTLAKGTGKKCLTEAQSAYLAGLVDSDGYVGIQNGGRQIRLVITMTNREVLQWMLEQTGMGVLAGRIANPEKNKVASFEWRSFSRDAAATIRTIFPYLIAKKTSGGSDIELRRVSCITIQPRRPYHQS